MKAGTRSRKSLAPTLDVGGFLQEMAASDIKRDVDIVALFAQFGVELVQKGTSYMGKCPWHDDTTPSLSVDRLKGVYHCFGCGESGDAISLVRKMRGCDFSAALQFLAERAITVPAPKAAKPKEVIQQVVQELSLDDIVRHYQRVLSGNLQASEYLESRGLKDRTLWNRLRLGYSDGSLVDKLSNNQRDQLVERGILSRSGKEIFSGYIIVPLLDENDQVVSLYGRAIDAKTHPVHRYLAGARGGLVNGEAVSVYRDKLIITESIIDAVSLMQIGIQNVIPSYGTGGVSEQMISVLVEKRVKDVVIAFDSDEAGIAGADKLARRLIDEGMRVGIIHPEGAKDWNELLIAGRLLLESLNRQIASAQLQAPCRAERSGAY
jgi:DNA primase